MESQAASAVGSNRHRVGSVRLAACPNEARVLVSQSMLTRSWRCSLVLTGILTTFLFCGLAGQVVADSSQAGGPPVGAKVAQTVQLVIDYGDGIQKTFGRIPWKEGMTVKDMMDVAKSGGHGIQYQFTGSGDTTFLTRIDDVKNEGGGATARNWVYSVDGKPADRSFGVYKVNAGADVVWKFDVYRAPGKK